MYCNIAMACHLLQGHGTRLQGYKGKSVISKLLDTADPLLSADTKKTTAMQLLLSTNFSLKLIVVTKEC